MQSCDLAIQEYTRLLTPEIASHVQQVFSYTTQLISRNGKRNDDILYVGSMAHVLGNNSCSLVTLEHLVREKAYNTLLGTVRTPKEKALIEAFWMFEDRFSAAIVPGIADSIISPVSTLGRNIILACAYDSFRKTNPCVPVSEACNIVARAISQKYDLNIQNVAYRLSCLERPFDKKV